MSGERHTRVPSDIPGRLRGEGGRLGRGGGFIPAGGSAPTASAPSRGPRAPSRNLSVPMPWDSRPLGAREINVDASAFGFAAGTAVIPGSAITVPADNVGVIRSVTFNVNTLLTTSLIRWSFRANGVPIDGWSQLSIFPRNAGFAAAAYGPDETWIFLETGQTVDVAFTVDAADPNVYQAGVTYHGWSYPKRLHELFSSVYLR